MKRTHFTAFLCSSFLASSPIFGQDASSDDTDVLEEELAEPEPADDAAESEAAARVVSDPQTAQVATVSFDGKMGYAPSVSDESAPKLVADVAGWRFTNLDLKVDYSSSYVTAEADYDFNLNAMKFFEISRAFWDNSVILSFGNIRVAQGGNESAFQSNHDLFLSPYVEQLTPFAQSAPAMQLKLVSESAGSLRMQLLQDVTRREADGPGYYTTARHQPAVAFDWHIVFGKVTPRIQFGSYDSNHSNYKTMGIRVANKHVAVNYDYIQDLRYRVDNSNNTSSINRVQSMNLSLDLKANQNIILKGKFSDLGVIQGEGDVFGNPPPVEGYVLITDNATVWSVGMETPILQWNLTPCAHYRVTKVRYLNDDTQNLNDTKDLTSKEYFLGIIMKL